MVTFSTRKPTYAYLHLIHINHQFTDYLWKSSHLRFGQTKRLRRGWICLTASVTERGKRAMPMPLIILHQRQRNLMVWLVWFLTIAKRRGFGDIKWVIAPAFVEKLGASSSPKERVYAALFSSFPS